MAEDVSSIDTDSIYSPAALLHIFNGLLTPAQTKKIIRLKGVYRTGKGALYGGYYYDVLADETAEAQLTLIVPARLRPSLTDNTTIEFQGYVTKRVALAQGRIEIQVTITELLEERVNKYTAEEVRAVAIQQQKADQGFRDIRAKRRIRARKKRGTKFRRSSGLSQIKDCEQWAGAGDDPGREDGHCGQ